jgi:N-acetylglucosaminyldiphosphoundecaprenol N-acetyl-beta-D-mannosaminyltransferase
MTNLGEPSHEALTALEVDIDLGLGQRQAPMVDFQRPVHALLGLPIDAVDMPTAVAAVRRAASGTTPFLVATPNLNFATGALSDVAFRESLTGSDLNLPDGMPLVWVARLLGLPLRRRVCGADLFDALAAHAEPPPVSVFFFGGPDGAAHGACQRVNQTMRGLRCVGFASPGFGTVEQMSAEAYLSRINACGAQFVVVALGAKKGQAWLRRNHLRLAPPVRCHLGAVVNFTAGTVRRAPRLLQRLGLEWLWRIGQEPALWRRYALDGLAFAGLLLTSVLPLVVARRLERVPEDAWQGGGLASATTGDTCTVTLSGPWAARNLQPLRDALAQAAAGSSRLRVVMREVTHVDSACIGVLMLAPRAFPLGFELVDVPRPIARTLRRHRAGWLLATGSGGGAHA